MASLSCIISQRSESHLSKFHNQSESKHCRAGTRTRPGEQFVIRRRAYAMIKKAFDANGIWIAFPTVQVAGGEEGSAAAVARQGLELMVAPPAA